MKKILFITIILASISLNAQTKISGKVVDKDNIPLFGAVIMVQDAPIAVTTDIRGHFVLNIPSTYAQNFVVISYGGMITKSLNAAQILNDTVVMLYEDFLDFNNDDGHIIVKKPIIYLYPQQETNVSVTLNVNGKIQNTYPEYSNGWNVLAEPNGNLTNKADNSQHRYLFWDAEVNKTYAISDFKTGFVVKGNESAKFLDSILTAIGLNQFEKNDFITYWMPQMKQNNYNFVHFLINEECNQTATMNISPKPDTKIRVYMYFSAVENPYSVKPQNLQKIERKGFTVVEWGGFDKIIK